jgi:ankyrin repeat protein
MDEDLFKAAKYKGLNAINDLIRKGADVNATNVFLATPLIVAANAGKPHDLSAPDPL